MEDEQANTGIYKGAFAERNGSGRKIIMLQQEKKAQTRSCSTATHVRFNWADIHENTYPYRHGCLPTELTNSKREY